MDKASLTAIGFIAVITILFLAFLFDAVGQFRASGGYKTPDYVLEYAKLALQFAFGAGVFAAIKDIRRVHREKKTKSIDSSPDISECPGDDTRPRRRSKKEDS